MADTIAPPTIDFDTTQARADGVPDSAIAEFLASKAGFDLAAARRDKVPDSAIVDFLAPSAPKPGPAPTPEPAPVEKPKSETARRISEGASIGAGIARELDPTTIGKAVGQAAIETGGRAVSGLGAAYQTAAQAPVAFEEAKQQAVRRQAEIMDKIDAGADMREFKDLGGLDRIFAREYQISNPERRAAVREKVDAQIAALPTIEETPAGKAAGMVTAIGKEVSAGGTQLGEFAQKAVPLTEEEQARFTVQTAKIVTGLVAYVGAAAAGGLPAMIAYGGVEAMGITFDDAKAKGATDEEAAKAAFINGVVQGGLNAVPMHQAMKAMDAVPRAFRGEFIAAATEMVKSSGALLTFSQLAHLAENIVAKNTYDPERPVTQGLGENLGPTAAAGAVLPAAGAAARAAASAAARRVRPTPAEVAAPVMDSPSVDVAIERAREIVDRPAIEEHAVQAQEFGNRGEQDQAAILRLFGGLNEGQVERAPDGAWHYRDADDKTFQLQPWDGRAREDTITPALVAAQRQHYEQLGVKVVYFEDVPVNFDGAVDPNQPNTIFLSNKTQRNAAQVGAHEFTHVLEDTRLPDGTNLADILHQQVRAGMTAEGRAYAERLFGGEAPKREAFPEGELGDSLHGDAVTTHLIRELSADIGGEAPKFQTFMPRVIEAVEARFGAAAARDALGRLIAGIRQAMTTLRNFFFKPEDMAEYGQPPTESQKWVSNLEQIHGTLARMYAERYGQQNDLRLQPVGPQAPAPRPEGPQRLLPPPALVTPPPRPPITPENVFQPTTYGAPRGAEPAARVEENRAPPAEVVQPAAKAPETRPVPVEEKPAPAAKVAQQVVEARAETDTNPTEGVGRSGAVPAPKNGGAAHAKLFGDGAEAETLRDKGFDALSRDGQAKVMAHVLRAINDPKVLKSVVEAVPVDVMNMLVGKEVTARRLLDDPAMFTSRLPVSGDVAVPQPVVRFVDALSAAIAVNPAGTRAKEPSLQGGPRKVELPDERGTAEQASGADIWHGTVAGQEVSVHINPSEAQKEAGNYLKGSIRWNGLDLKIENPEGSIRRGVDEKGKEWEAKLPADYGYLSRTEGADGDHVDAYIGKHHDSQRVFVVDQVDPKTGKWDEHKVMLGTRSVTEARMIYQRAFSDGSGPKRIGAITEMSIDQLKAWLENGDTRKPLGPKQAEVAPRAEPTPVQKEKAKVSAMKERKTVAERPQEEPSPAPKTETQPIAAETVASEQRVSKFDKAVSDERERLWAEEMAGRKRGLPHNERMVTDTAREAVMRREAQKDLDWYLENGLPQDAVREVARVYRRQDGQTTREAMDQAVDRWTTLEELQGLRQFGDEDVATYDLLAAEGSKDPVIAEVFDRLDEYYNDRAKELPGDENIPLGTEPTETPERAGREAAREEAERPAGAEDREQLGGRGEAAEPPDELGPTFSPREVPLLDVREASKDELDARQRKVDKEVAEATMRGRKAPPKPQESAEDTPLFGGDRQKMLFSPRDRDVTPPFYSALTRAVENLKLEKGTPGQWAGTVKNLPGVKAEERQWVGLDDWLAKQAKSVTKQEVMDFLRANEIQVREVEKRVGGDDAEVRAFHDISEEMWNSLKDRERAELRSEFMADAAYEPKGDTKYAEYTLPGGRNYRELLLTLPPKTSPEGDAVAEFARSMRGEYGQRWFGLMTEAQRQKYDDLINAQERLEKQAELANYRSSHWDEPNVLAHIRFDDRTGPKGEKVLHVAEVQSDWHQEGRKKGYTDDAKEAEARAASTAAMNRTVSLNAEMERLARDRDPVTNVMREEGRWHQLARERDAARDEMERLESQIGRSVPDAPFKTTWPELAMKRMIRYAAENGYDRVSWDTGATNADRFDLSKQISKITLHDNSSGGIADANLDGPFEGGTLYARDHNGRQVIDRFVRTPEDVAELIGKEAAERLLNAPTRKARVAGVGLRERSLSGLDLKVGGEGMQAFYDKQLPLIASKIGKRFGAKVESDRVLTKEQMPFEQFAREYRANWGDLPPDQMREMHDQYGRDQSRPAHSLPITDAMRKAVVEQGQPLFSPRQVETPEFKRWFGDSKAVDPETGKPRVLYHGTTGDFSAFDRSRLGEQSGAPSAKQGFFFTSDPGIADSYAMGRNGYEGEGTPKLVRFAMWATGGRYANWNEAVNKVLGIGAAVTHGENIMPVYLSIKKPVVFDFEGKEYRERSFNDLIELAKEIDADGVIFKNAIDPGYRDTDASGAASDIYFAFRPEQIKSATGNRGTFDAANPDITFSPRITGENPDRKYTPEQREAFERVGRATETTTLRDKVDDARDDIGRKLIANTVDAYVGLKRNDPEGYMAVRLANSVAGAQEVFRLYGTLKFDGATYNYKDLNGGVRTFVRSLGPEAHDFLWWVAANRAERLKGEDRENLFTDADIAILKQLNRGELDFDYKMPNGTVTRRREAVYMDALRRYDALNKSVLDLVKESGLVGDKVVDQLWADPFYVPFYREAADQGTTRFAGPTSGFVKQYASKKLKGGSEKLRNDLWDNAFGNWDHMIAAALRNRAAVQVLQATARMGGATEIPAAIYENKLTNAEKAQTTWAMVDGKKRYWQVDDPLVFKAVSALENAAAPGPVASVARWFSRALRYGVTANPLFAVRNLIRDTENSIAVSQVSKNPFKNLADGFAQMDTGDRLKNLARAMAGKELEAVGLEPEAISAMAGGGLMRLGTLEDAGVPKTDLRNILDTPNKLQAFGRYIKDVAGAYKEALASGEDVNRLALYKQLREQGAPHDFASFSARDLQDFTLRGAAPFVRSITDITPFLNARMQGLYKLGRSASDADKNVAAVVGGRVARNLAVRTAAVLGAMTVASLALDAIYQDDPDYRKRTEFDRQSYYWFKIGDAQFRIPKGFELAALSSIAADGIEAFFSKEMTGERLANNIWTALGANLQVQAPAVIQPVLDIATNTRGTGGPIETAGMERMEPQQRFTSDTTLIARGMSSLINDALRTVAPRADGPSPVQIDYLVNAYGAWLATSVMGMADRVARLASNEPEKPDKDFWASATQGLVRTDPAPQSRYVDMLYEQGRHIEQAHATYLNLIKLGRGAETKEFVQDRKETLLKYPSFQRVKTLEGDLNRQIRVVENDRSLSGEQKRVRIMRLQALKTRAAEGLFTTGASP